MDSKSLNERRVVLFDFDGTLSDTTGCVIKTLEVVLARRGMTAQDMGDLRRFVGPPLVEAFQTIYGYTLDQARALTAEYRAVFDQWGPVDYPVFPGLAELIEDLAESGRTLAVATSRLESRAVEMLAELGLDRFACVCGLNPDAGRLTKADSIRDALKLCGVTPAQAVMVGDRHFDVEGAHAQGLPCVGVTYGGTSTPQELEAAQAEAVAQTVADLRRILMG